MPKRIQLYPAHTSPRIPALYICDVYTINDLGDEQLWNRKYYDKSGPAKAYRTREHKAFKVMSDYWQTEPSRRWHDSSDRPVVDRRIDVYALTPNGYETIP